MKRLTTYYFLLLACLNVLFAQILSFAMADYKTVLDNKFDGSALPPCTERVFQYPWWPWIGVTGCIIGAILSLWGKPRDNVLKNLLIVFLIVELWIMFYTVVAFHAPWVFPIGKLSSHP